MERIDNFDESLWIKMSEGGTVNTKDDLDKISFGLDSFCENCDQLAEMSEQNVFKRRKTRRGRKKPYKLRKDTEVCDTIYENSLNIQNHIMKQTAKGKHKKIVRTPVSPKAPMNSTQFLIEDRCGYMAYNNLSYLGLQSPDQTLSNSPQSAELDGSFYTETHSKMEKSLDPTCGEDSEYSPLEETYDFIGREFEREFAESQYSHEMDTRLSLKNKLINESTKQEIIEKFIKLDMKLKEVFNEEISSNTSQFTRKRSDLMSEIKHLREENSSLKEENDLLKSLIS